MAIAVPPDVQAELAVRAAAAGRHLLLDKPLALSLDAADRVAEAVTAAEVASLVFFTLRFLPELAAWMEQATAPGAGTAATAPGWARPCSRAAPSPARPGGGARAPSGTSAPTCSPWPSPPSGRWSGWPPAPASATPSTWSWATAGAPPAP